MINGTVGDNQVHFKGRSRPGSEQVDRQIGLTLGQHPIFFIKSNNNQSNRLDIAGAKVSQLPPHPINVLAPVRAVYIKCLQIKIIAGLIGQWYTVDAEGNIAIYDGNPEQSKLFGPYANQIDYVYGWVSAGGL